MDYLSINPVNDIGAVTAQRPVRREEAADEFAKIFYKELLKQVFLNSSMSEGSMLPASVNQDVFIEKLAEEMVRKNRGLIDMKGTGKGD